MEESAKSIKQKIDSLGPMLPGKINTQWLRCKTKGCKCMNAENPQKHGPYNQLSFSFGGKSSTMNIKDEDMEEAQKYLKNYKEFLNLSKSLVLANISEIRQVGFSKK